ncbi:protein of unknown function DUF151 [Beutenbergia cavernae DSM 12333]|uniref:BFN domain-containing protein n=2 Tax=Beutenbergia TaxID=84756 RepID=C5C6E7_BEUC1|nr:protein of unknown function DUF151 [Beutenbergia cavernae DSM 12333]
MDVLGVRVRLPASEVVVLLAERGGQLVVPILIGPREGAAIASAQAGIVPPRPQTHDLLLDVVTILGSSLVEVRVVALREGTFYAELELAGGIVVDSRASDAIALALRAEVPIRCAPDVLATAGIELEEEDPDDADQQERATREIEEFRNFLDHVSAEDFGDSPGGNEGTQADR